jgi:hypothetical protein
VCVTHSVIFQSHLAIIIIVHHHQSQQPFLICDQQSFLLPAFFLLPAAAICPQFSLPLTLRPLLLLSAAVNIASSMHNRYSIWNQTGWH